MRPVVRLRNLRLAVFRRAERFERQIATASLQPVDPQVDMLVSDACIGLLNTWSNFARAYYLSCFLLPRREGGGRITVAGAFTAFSFNDAIDHSIAILRPYKKPRGGGVWDSRDEPTWHEASTLLKLSSSIGCSNSKDISDGLAGAPQVLRDLPTFRNFYAHRNRNTWESAMRLRHGYGIIARDRPTSVLLSCAYGRPQPLLLDWVSELKDAVEYLCL